MLGRRAELTAKWSTAKALQPPSTQHGRLWRQPTFLVTSELSRIQAGSSVWSKASNSWNALLHPRSVLIQWEHRSGGGKNVTDVDLLMLHRLKWVFFAESWDVFLQPNVVLWCGRHNDSYWLHATFQKLRPKRPSNLRPQCRWWLVASSFTSREFTAALVAVSAHLSAGVFLFVFFHDCQVCVIRETGSGESAQRSRTRLTVMSCKGVRRQYRGGSGRFLTVPSNK